MARIPSALTMLLAAALSLGAQTPDFQRDIAPIFERSCGACHINASMGKLRLDTAEAVLRGGQSGPSVIPGHSAESLLVKRILAVAATVRMPLGGQPLPETDVKLIRAWIDSGALHTASTQAASVPGSTVFAKEVRPILAARCYSCHGPDVQQNGLRLDSLASLLKGSDNGPIVVPHEVAKSRLMRRLEAQERPQMPYGGPPLSTDEIQIIAQWIQAGAPGPDDLTPLPPAHPTKHWAYVRPIRPVPPQVADSAWLRNPIDNFILARLEKEGLKPSPEAAKSTLLRRVYLDLTGLPPMPAQLEAFLKDTRPDAYERVVDELFASPHYGEKWARQWLDLARYADSNGYEKDRQRTAWEYRDWVIRALNADLSFKEFTIDQIAGDMLPNPTRDQLIATGFNRNSMLNQEGGIDVNEYYYYSLVDRVNTTASVWLGSTLGCAQCHNHKFDPFPQKDYYRFLAFFSNAERHIEGTGDRWMAEPELPLPTPEQEKKNNQLEAAMSTIQAELDTQTPELDAAQAQWERRLREAPMQWRVLQPGAVKSAGGAQMKVQADGSVLAAGENPQADTYLIEAALPKGAVTGVRLEALPDKSLPKGGPGRDPAGNFFLSDFDIEVNGRPVAWKSVSADESQDGYSAGKLAKKEPGSLRGWAIQEGDPGGIERQAVFVPASPFSGTAVKITLQHQMRRASRNLGRFRISVTSSANPAEITQVSAILRPLLDVAPEQRTAEQKVQLSAAYRSVAPLLEPLRKQMADLRKQQKSLGIVTAMVMKEEVAFARPAAYVRERGTFTSPGELVYANVPGALNSLPPDAMPNRLGLAEWLVSDDNPLTARVTVNHYWEAIFGHGIVETSEDFGTQGDLPSHPELLDWLAAEFMSGGWSPKKIQRLIVTSAAYRQSSHVTPELLAKDPYNRLLAHGPRFRVDAETVHDLALAESGLLSSKMYGPPVFPYQPEGVWDIPYSSDKWIESKGEDQRRRAIYTMIRRSAPYPSLTAYDAPSREFCTVRRVRTNTPLQALTSLNDPYFFAAARALGSRLEDEGGNSTAEKIRLGFLLTASRLPSASELAKVESFFQARRAEFAGDPAAAAKLMGQAADTADGAAWTMVANVLLNSDEAITKE